VSNEDPGQSAAERPAGGPRFAGRASEASPPGPRFTAHATDPELRTTAAAPTTALGPAVHPPSRDVVKRAVGRAWRAPIFWAVIAFAGIIAATVGFVAVLAAKPDAPSGGRVYRGTVETVVPYGEARVYTILTSDDEVESAVIVDRDVSEGDAVWVSLDRSGKAASMVLQPAWATSATVAGLVVAVAAILIALLSTLPVLRVRGQFKDRPLVLTDARYYPPKGVDKLAQVFAPFGLIGRGLSRLTGGRADLAHGTIVVNVPVQGRFGIHGRGAATAVQRGGIWMPADLSNPRAVYCGPAGKIVGIRQARHRA
jgi:hypothetical protein